MPIIKRSSGPQSPSSSPSSSKTASLHPHDFDRTFDAIAELEANKDLYRGDQWITLLNFPSYLTTCLERVKQDADQNRIKIGGMSSIVSCCIAHGLDMISGDSRVKAILHLKSILHSTHDVPAIELEELASWFRSFPLSHPDPSSAGIRKQNVTLTQAIKSELGDTARDLGMSSTSLATLAITCTLSTEKSMLNERKVELEQAIATFFRRVEIRKKVAEVWLASLGIKVGYSRKW